MNIKKYLLISILVVGIDAIFLKLIEKIFKHIPKSTKTKLRVPFEKYTPFQKKIAHSGFQTHAKLGSIAFEAKSNKKTSMILLNNILGGPGMNSRLNLSIREKYGFTYAIESNYTTYCDTGLWSIYFGTEAQSVKKTLKLIFKELKKLRDVKLGPLQLQRAKQQLIGQLAIAQENKCNLMQNIAKSYQSFGRVESMEEVKHKITSITAKDLKEVAQEIFNEDLLSSILFEPKEL